jgi:serine/threonine protein kinase
MQSQTTAVQSYQASISAMSVRRQEYLETFKGLRTIGEKANAGQLKNIFMPGHRNKFQLSSLIVKKSLKSLFSYLPETPSGQLSAYEAFHFLFRSGVLSAAVSTFTTFLRRFAPSEFQTSFRVVDSVWNVMLPVQTAGLYDSITHLAFNASQIQEMVSVLDPVDALLGRLSTYTVSETIPQRTEKRTTRRSWLQRYRSMELYKRLNMLEGLESTVKHEAMNRVQEGIAVSFRKNLSVGIQPVAPIELRPKTAFKNGFAQEFSGRRHLNPLLEKGQYASIYESWSKFSLFARDATGSTELKALHIPNLIMNRRSIDDHIEFVRRLAAGTKCSASSIFSIESDGQTTQIVLADDSRSLSLNHYLTVHSFLGGNPQLILAARSILGHVLGCLYQLHKNDIILRCLCPENVLINIQTGIVRIGSLLDAQEGRANCLPLPSHFTDPSNPFLPPEFYHCSPREYTAKFDVWQFGVLLMYVITGSLPPSYGTQLLQHIAAISLSKSRTEEKPQKDMFSDPPLYPQFNFFYDWLKEIKIVNPTESVLGPRGECYISTGKLEIQSSILELDSLRLLPFKSTRLNVDETKLFLEMIAMCLQIEPEKRPTVEELLRTYLFNQNNPATDIIEDYLRSPNANVFLGRFVTPAFEDLCDSVFPFALGILTSMLFHEELLNEDCPYSFPLDPRSAERVLTGMIELKFLDKLVTFALASIQDRVKVSDVVPHVIFKDAKADSLMKFFLRFVASAEHGQGSLMNYTNDVIMSLLSFYAANPYMKQSSSQLAAGVVHAERLLTRDSAPLFMYT